MLVDNFIAYYRITHGEQDVEIVQIFYDGRDIENIVKGNEGVSKEGMAKGRNGICFASNLRQQAKRKPRNHCGSEVLLVRQLSLGELRSTTGGLEAVLLSP